MHNAALEHLRQQDDRFAGWHYFRFDVPPDQLEFALKRLHQKGFVGINLTIPHKVDVLAQLKQVSPSAQLMGAVNTLQAQKHGYSGFNTDGFGLEQGLRQDLDQALTDCDILLLGSGGAARAAAVHCLERGCKHLHIANRNPERLARLLEQLTGTGRRDAVTCSSLKALPQAWAPKGLVINATSVGLAAGDPSPVDLRQLPPAWKVYDMIYNPARTPLLQQAAGQRTPMGQWPLHARCTKAPAPWRFGPKQRSRPKPCKQRQQPRCKRPVIHDALLFNFCSRPTPTYSRCSAWALARWWVAS
jgi:shikimate dehydrogenase